MLPIATLITGRLATDHAQTKNWGRALSFVRLRKEALKLAAESDGAAYRIRTYDPRITNAMLYQLS